LRCRRFFFAGAFFFSGTEYGVTAGVTVVSGAVVVVVSVVVVPASPLQVLGALGSTTPSPSASQVEV
jgi:hypothetical protein